jgi:hypothetical protein
VHVEDKEESTFAMRKSWNGKVDLCEAERKVGKHRKSLLYEEKHFTMKKGLKKGTAEKNFDDFSTFYLKSVEKLLFVIIFLLSIPDR